MAVVGQLDRWPDPIMGIYKARDICYGLFSAIFAIAVLFGTPYQNTGSSLSKYWSDNDGDPWEVDDRVSARREIEIQKSLDEWSAEADRQFKERVEAITESGAKTAPGIRVVLDYLRAEVRLLAPTDWADQILSEEKLQHLDRMQSAFRDWTPVQIGDTPAHNFAHEAGGERACTAGRVSPVLSEPGRDSSESQGPQELRVSQDSGRSPSVGV